MKHTNPPYLYNAKLVLFLLSSYLFLAINVCAQNNEKAPIVIVSSYNPDAQSMSSYISNFFTEYKKKEIDRDIIIENMNCKALSESPKWSQMMEEILSKYTSYRPRPALIILLGQEAFTAYLSQTTHKLPHIPIMAAMVTRNTLRFPKGKFDPANIEIKSEDVMALAKQYNIVGGYLYEYNIDKNIQLIKKLYPKTKKIAFLTDNSCGGICQHTFINQEMKKYPEYEYLPLDGRKNTIYSMISRLTKLRDKTVLVLGSWRMDKNEGFFLHNTVYLMKDVNSRLPVFSISTIGIGNWAIGGYTPCYRNTEKDLANDAYRYVNLKNHGNVKINILPLNYLFDARVVAQTHIKAKLLPKNAQYINQPESFWEKYKNLIISISIAFIILTGIILILIYFLVKTNALKNALLISQKELMEAKEKAEESAKLEKAFVANMSHEIRTPLNAIVGFTNLLTTSDIPDVQKEEFKTIIQQNSNLLLNLINDVLDLSRLEVNYIKFNYENEDIVGLCKSLLLTEQTAHPSKLEYIFESPLTEYIAPIDMKHMQQVLINLLTNANKFTKAGSITLSFDVDNKKKHMLFAVKDTGCGIPPEKRNSIFERFTKLNAYAQGFGLGLSICRIAVERLGGKIWVDPDYNKGACFRFYIPIRTKAQVETGKTS